jgi:hypothetical protein
VSTFYIFPFAKEENPTLAAQTFAVKELANRRSYVYAGCVHTEHFDPSDRNGSRGCDRVSEKHAFSGA